jgi:serine/threonine-protein kinase
MSDPRENARSGAGPIDEKAGQSHEAEQALAGESELHIRSRAQLGTTIKGKYRLDRVLGIGGMAVVFVATHRNLKRFAVKMLHAELSFREDIRTRFLREGYAANALEHPGAVAVLDDDVAEDGSAFLVMELLEGGGLDHLWDKSGRRMPPRVVLALGYQLLDVLAAAHAKGIVHRDIKPPNLFLTRDGTLKVLDFGIARVRDAMSTGGMATGTGMLLGTPAFMAPEQALAKSSEIDGQSDVWAAGATLFTLLSGQLVHEGDNATQLLVKAATTQARSLATVAPSTPAGVVRLVDRALAFDKEARWPSAEAMRDAIGEVYGEMFGEPLSRAPLATLFEGSDHTVPPTRHVGTHASPAPRSSFARSPSAQTVDPPRNTPWPRLATSGGAVRSTPGGTLQAGVTPIGAYVPGSTVGMSTAKPVSSDGPDTPHGVPSRKRTRPLTLVAVAGAVVAAVAVAGLEFHRPSEALGPAAAAGLASTPLAASSSESPATPPPRTVPPPTVSPTTPTSSPEPQTSPSAAPVMAAALASVPTRAAAPTSAKPPVTTHAGAPHHSASPPTPPSSPTTHAPNCNPPYVIDSSGKHQYKPECL